MKRNGKNIISDNVLISLAALRMALALVDSQLIEGVKLSFTPFLNNCRFFYMKSGTL